MEIIFGGLIEFSNKKEFNDFISTIDTPNSISLIEMALEFANKSGLYSMEETYALYSALKKLKNHQHEDGNLPNNNSNGDTNN